MTGALARVKIQGTVLSILLARAISIAAAEKGFGKKIDGVGLNGSRGVPPFIGEVRLPGEPFGGRSAGVIRGEEKQRR